MSETQTQPKAITLSFPRGYTEEDIEPFRLQFPHIQVVLGVECFSIEVRDDEFPLAELKAVFAWIEKNIRAGSVSRRADTTLTGGNGDKGGCDA